ncbi:MAG: hypothetical protein NVS3B26_29140 [Mycobacteriales bacterium]
MTASPLIVLERAVQVHTALDRAGVRHAVGGALALAYHVAEARATRDIDLNVAADPDHPQALFALLPADVPWDERDVRTVRDTGQVRLYWPHPDGQPPIPLDLFFPQSEFHRQLNARAEVVAMLDSTIPIVSATDLMVLKMLFDRRKDWADIEELVRYGSPDVVEARSWLIRIVGPGDVREGKLDQLLAELPGR